MLEISWWIGNGEKGIVSGECGEWGVVSGISGLNIKLFKNSRCNSAKEVPKLYKKETNPSQNSYKFVLNY